MITAAAAKGSVQSSTEHYMLYQGHQEARRSEKVYRLSLTIFGLHMGPLQTYQLPKSIAVMWRYSNWSNVHCTPVRPVTITQAN